MNIKSHPLKVSGAERIMQVSAEQAMLGYADAYQKLYRRMPKDLCTLDGNWISVNGARIQASELELLTDRLRQEYTQTQDQKRSFVSRLSGWLK